MRVMQDIFDALSRLRKSRQNDSGTDEDYIVGPSGGYKLTEQDSYRGPGCFWFQSTPPGTAVNFFLRCDVGSINFQSS